VDPLVTSSRLNFIILSLKKSGKLRDVGRGVYAPGDKVHYDPPTDEMMTSLIGHLKEEFLMDDPYDIWSTEWLNDFMQLQATSIIYIVEVGKEDLERVFFKLRDHYSFVFANPGKAVIDTYISGLYKAIIVLPLSQGRPWIPTGL
jgi:hypothetical protein